MKDTFKRGQDDDAGCRESIRHETAGKNEKFKLNINV